MLGKIKSIQEVHDFKIEPIAPMNGTGGKLGLGQMINALSGYSGMDGYKIETDKHTYLVLIDNMQSCCESWGYLSSDDDMKQYIGDKLLEVTLTDSALETEVIEKAGLEYGFDEGGIKFVSFKTNKSVFQLAVYNCHNGYYGHGILIAKDNKILLNDTL